MVKQLARRDAKFKFDVAMQLLTGAKTADELCVKYGATRTSLYRWRQHFLDEGPRLFRSGSGRPPSEQVRVLELERMIGRLTMEVEALKKASRLLNSRSKKGES